MCLNFFKFNTLLIVVHAAATSASAGLIWPTPNPAFQEGQPIEAFIQPTVSGVVESGLFGCVRNNGSRFHEALDLYPIKRDRRGEALDPVFAVLPGRVVHVNATAGYSSYGRYVVVEHDGESPAFHTLYAHLASIADGLAPGARVESGTTLGVMGRSAAGYSIPKERSHLHFEIGFRLTDDFQIWYDRQKFGSKNRHGVWNGMNMVSIDPLGFYRAMRSGKVSNFYEYVRTIPVVARIRIHTTQIPNFVQNYPALVTRPHEGKQVVAWDIAFTEFGVPKEWTPRFSEENISGRAGDVRVLAYSPSALEAQSCRRVLNLSASGPTIASGTLTTLRKLFGFK
jgi:murein DD-endopeptidase MepM/ murein hydrolase activator NlpD